MTDDARRFIERNRWVVVGPWLAVSIVPSALITALLAAPGTFLREWPAVWLAFLLGPLSRYVFPPGASTDAWALLPAVLAPALFAHAVRPRASTALVTSAGFTLWYGAAFLVVVGMAL